MTTIIDGKLIAQNLKDKLKTEITHLTKKYNRSPGLAVVQVGNVASQ